MTQMADVDSRVDQLLMSLSDSFDKAMPFQIPIDIVGLDGYEVKKDEISWYVKSPVTQTILTMTAFNQGEVDRVLSVFAHEPELGLSNGLNEEEVARYELLKTTYFHGLTPGEWFSSGKGYDGTGRLEEYEVLHKRANNPPPTFWLE